MNETPDPLGPEEGEQDCAPDGLYWRLRGFSTLIGVPARTVLDDCLSGRIPVRVERFGERQLPYVLKRDALSYVASISKGNAS